MHKGTDDQRQYLKVTEGEKGGDNFGYQLLTGRIMLVFLICQN